MTKPLRTVQQELLLKALREYGTWDFPKTQQELTVVNYNGRQYAMEFKDVCRQSFEFLEKEALYTARFIYLVTEMKKMGMDHMYEHIMKHPISEAIIK